MWLGTQTAGPGPERGGLDADRGRRCHYVGRPGRWDPDQRLLADDRDGTGGVTVARTPSLSSRPSPR